MYYFEPTRCRATICIVGVLILVKVGSKTIVFDGLVSRCASSIESHDIFMKFCSKFRIQWQVECEISLSPLCFLCPMKYG